MFLLSFFFKRCWFLLLAGRAAAGWPLLTALSFHLQSSAVVSCSSSLLLQVRRVMTDLWQRRLLCLQVCRFIAMLHGGIDTMFFPPRCPRWRQWKAKAGMTLIQHTGECILPTPLRLLLSPRIMSGMLRRVSVCTALILFPTGMEELRAGEWSQGARGGTREKLSDWKGLGDQVDDGA